MSSYLKTCIAEVLLLALLALPIVIAGCERPSQPPGPMSVQPSVAQDPGATPVKTGGVRTDDAAITARVKTALLAEEQVKGFSIDVDTKDGAVTLTGELESDEQVLQALAVARGVEGVKDVVNRLTVTGEDKAARSTTG